MHTLAFENFMQLDVLFVWYAFPFFFLLWCDREALKGTAAGQDAKILQTKDSLWEEWKEGMQGGLGQMVFNNMGEGSG